jgi:GNAT superfamily N-acetyltransferase
MLAVFASGGEMCVVEDADRVVGVAVFRCFENTHVGRKFYIDDLITDEDMRSGGVGHALLAFLEQLARQRGCSGLELDSGTQRTRAHKFYFREGFVIPSFAFRKEFK